MTRREELIRETFELSREIGYAHFRAENFDRPDPVLVRLSPEQRETFLREWWDAARERMYASYLEQIAGMSNEELARNRETYKLAMATGKMAGTSEKTPDRAAGENSGRKDDIRAPLSDQLFAPAPPTPTPEPAHTNDRTRNLTTELFRAATPQPEPQSKHTRERQHKR